MDVGKSAMSGTVAYIGRDILAVGHDTCFISEEPGILPFCPKREHRAN